MCGDGSGCWLRWGHFWDFSIFACMRTQPLGGGFEVSACLLTLFPCPPGGSPVTLKGAAAPGWGQEPCSLLLLQGGAAADPAREE